MHMACAYQLWQARSGDLHACTDPRHHSRMHFAFCTYLKHKTFW